MKQIKSIYSKEYLILICVGFLPLIWKVLEFILLSGFINAIKILGQIAFIGIIFKVFEETLLNPLYKTFNQNNFSNNDDKFYIAKKFLYTFITITTLFTISITLLNPAIIKISKVPEYLINDTQSFFNIYIVASGFGVLAKYVFTFSIINKDTKKMLTYLIIKAIITALLFLIFVPNFTLGLGVNGVALAELIVNIISTLILSIYLFKSKKTNASLDKKLYCKLLIYSFFETLIRNIVYYFIILVFLNIVDNQDLYFVANDFIWSIMLIPTLAQSTLIKQDVAQNNNFSIKKYLLNCILLISFMLLLLPIALLTFKHIYSFNNYLDYFLVLLKLTPCYLLFVVDSVIEAYFIATGQLFHILLQNLLTNIGVYLTAFILYLFNIWTISLNSIIILFNLGVIVSSIYTISIFIIKTKCKNYKSSQISIPK